MPETIQVSYQKKRFLDYQEALFKILVGNPAIYLRPVDFRTQIALSLALSQYLSQIIIYKSTSFYKILVVFQYWEKVFNEVHPIFCVISVLHVILSFIGHSDESRNPGKKNWIPDQVRVDREEVQVFILADN